MKELIFLLMCTSSLAIFACGEDNNKFCVGDRASIEDIDVRILEMYANGTARISFEDFRYNEVIPISSLSHIVLWLDGFNVGEAVMSNNLDVHILEIYSNHDARVKADVDGSISVIPTSNLVKKINCEP